MVIHTVQEGDSIYSLWKKYGVSPEVIVRDNDLKNPDRLTVGQALIISPKRGRYIIRKGDSLFVIARNNGISIEDLLKANPSLSMNSLLQPGQIINIPEPPKPQIDVNGYAFPNIDMDVLNKTLPYLTYLSIFSYEAKPDGSLANIPDEALIQAARNAKVAPMMVISNIEEGKGFSSELAHSILNNEGVQDTLIKNVLSTMASKNYSGLDIDFEYVFPQDRENYNNFLRKVSERIRPQGYILVTALAPKTSANQPGLLYEAHDYPVHGQVADHVIIMTYEWGYTYGPAQAVAPINEVRKVLDYAVTAIPSEKILMGMPNYGYDWTLPFVKGSAARPISNTRAVELATDVKAAIQYDTKSQAPFFYYYDTAKKRHEVWFDDARSIKARLELVDQYNLGGVSYWTINRFFPQNWLVLDSMYTVRKVL